MTDLNLSGTLNTLHHQMLKQTAGASSDMSERSSGPDELGWPTLGSADGDSTERCAIMSGASGWQVLIEMYHLRARGT
jgi:hypothetical protein